jgi:hypothetical protein
MDLIADKRGLNVSQVVTIESTNLYEQDIDRRW